jgi:hypothetical protein
MSAGTCLGIRLIHKLMNPLPLLFLTEDNQNLLSTIMKSQKFQRPDPPNPNKVAKDPNNKNYSV